MSLDFEQIAAQCMDTIHRGLEQCAASRLRGARRRLDNIHRSLERLNALSAFGEVARKIQHIEVQTLPMLGLQRLRAIKGIII